MQYESNEIIMMKEINAEVDLYIHTFTYVYTA
jgi:hypothetical protein